MGTRIGILTWKGSDIFVVFGDELNLCSAQCKLKKYSVLKHKMRQFIIKMPLVSISFSLCFVESSDFDGIIPTASLDGSYIPVAIVTQTSLDVVGPAGTATATVEITTPPLDMEELAVDPMDRDMTSSGEELTTESDGKTLVRNTRG